MVQLTTQDLQEDLENLHIPEESGYMYSYPHFIDHFKTNGKLQTKDLVIGAYFSYGWMPTILQLNSDIAEQHVEKFRKLKATKFPFEGNARDIEPLHEIQNTNNGSVVGMSKLLHFLNPGCFPIYDSRVYQYFYKEEPYSYRINTLDKYVEYISIVNRVISEDDFAEIILDPINVYIKERFGYKVKGPRAVELIMYATQVNKASTPAT